jgi:hypothetical protein
MMRWEEKVKIRELNPMFSYRFKKRGEHLVIMTEGVPNGLR